MRQRALRPLVADIHQTGVNLPQCLLLAVPCLLAIVSSVFYITSLMSFALGPAVSATKPLETFLWNFPMVGCRLFSPSSFPFRAHSHLKEHSCNFFRCGSRWLLLALYFVAINREKFYVSAPNGIITVFRFMTTKPGSKKL